MKAAAPNAPEPRVQEISEPAPVGLEKKSAPTPVKKEEAPKKVENKAPVQIDSKMQDISTYNGDRTDRYNWSQHITAVEVQVPLPEGTKSKMLDVKITSKKLFVKIKSESEAIIEGEFYETVKEDECFWNVEDGKNLILSIEKSKETIWKTVIKGDQEIDPKKVDNAKKIEEFDEETQGHLQQVLYEQNRKLNGLPTTEEAKQQEQMKKIFNSENSPWAGAPYDPDKFIKQGGPPSIPFKN